MFSVTNVRGFVNQQEQFEDREMKGEDIAAYKIVSPCLSLKKVDSQQARNNVYLSNTEEGAVL